MAAAVASASALALEDPERLLWEPGKKTIVDLGATTPVLQPTLEQTARLSPLFVDATQPFERDRALAPLRPLYMPDRYRVDLSNGDSFGFDSDWRMQSAYRAGQPLSDREKARIADDFARAARQKINTRTMTLED